ncbi:ATP-binding cassette domain-containing protein [Fodinicola feengrottensis]|nr:ATP-binding cassette domain-containing protein [Fodinicola feengrottensis]
MTGLVWRSAPWHLVAYVVLTALGGLTSVVVAWLTKLALDRLVSPGPVGLLLAAATGIAVWGLVGALNPQFGQYLRAELDRRAGLRAKDTLFAAVERFTGLSRFEDPEFLDRLRLAEQSATSPGQLIDSVLVVGRGGVTLIGFVGALAIIISPWFTFVVLAAAAPALLVELRLAKQRTEMILTLTPIQRRELFYASMLSMASAAKEIRLFGLGPLLRGRMITEARRGNATSRDMDRKELVHHGGLIALAGTIAGTGLVWALMAAGAGELTVGDVSLFVAATAAVQSATSAMVSAAARVRQQVLLFEHFDAVISAGPDLPEPSQPGEISALRKGIELRDVWFRYSDAHPWVLRGVNLFLPHQSTVALVGRNGGGKSTIVKLLCRFYDPTRGEIRWDGVDIRDIPVGELRTRMGAVFQDFVAYDFSASDNIAIGDLSAIADPDRIELAARRAGVHDAIAALPRGYDTLLTRAFRSQSDVDRDPGVVLSGGQWQRVALARAFLREDRDLVILDEPSAGLDAEAEHEVHSRLREIRAGRTSLLISHRLGTIRGADHIAPRRRSDRRAGHALRTVGRRWRLCAVVQPAGRRLSGGDVMIAAAALLVLIIGGVFWLRGQYSVITVRGESMSPAYEHGDRLLLRRKSAIGVGQVVVFADQRSAGPPHWILKRVAAVPGDPVPQETQHHIHEEHVPPAQLVVLGDNASHSTDSRHFGYVATNRILGVVLRHL